MTILTNPTYNEEVEQNFNQLHSSFTPQQQQKEIRFMRRSIENAINDEPQGPLTDTTFCNNPRDPFTSKINDALETMKNPEQKRENKLDEEKSKQQAQYQSNLDATDRYLKKYNNAK